MVDGAVHIAVVPTAVNAEVAEYSSPSVKSRSRTVVQSAADAAGELRVSANVRQLLVELTAYAH